MTNSGTNPYKFASIDVSGIPRTGGSAAVLIPELTPQKGFGHNAPDDLPSWFVGLGADFNGSGAETSDIPVSGLSFRQVSVLNDPYIDSQSAFTSYSALRKFTLSGDYTTTFSSGSVIAFSNGAKAFVDYSSHAGGTTTVLYHQNSSPLINTTPPASPLVSVTSPSGTVTVITSSITLSATQEYEFSDSQNMVGGDVIFFENVKAKARSTTQNEEIRIIIQL